MTSRDELTRTETRVTERVVTDKETVTWFVCPNCGEDHLTGEDVVAVTLGGPLHASPDTRDTGADWRLLKKPDHVETLLCAHCADAVFGEGTTEATGPAAAGGELEALSPTGAKALVQASAAGAVEKYERRRARRWSSADWSLWDALAAFLDALGTTAEVAFGILSWMVFPLAWAATTAILLLAGGAAMGPSLVVAAVVLVLATTAQFLSEP